MGQAKRRGTFEDRRQQSIEAAEAARIERDRKEAEWWNSLTDEQKEHVREIRRQRVRRMALLASFSAGLFYRR